MRKTKPIPTEVQMRTVKEYATIPTIKNLVIPMNVIVLENAIQDINENECSGLCINTQCLYIESFSCHDCLNKTSNNNIRREYFSNPNNKIKIIKIITARHKLLNHGV